MKRIIIAIILLLILLVAIVTYVFLEQRYIDIDFERGYIGLDFEQGYNDKVGIEYVLPSGKKYLIHEFEDDFETLCRKSGLGVIDRRTQEVYFKVGRVNTARQACKIIENKFFSRYDNNIIIDVLFDSKLQIWVVTFHEKDMMGLPEIYAIKKEDGSLYGYYTIVRDPEE